MAYNANQRVKEFQKKRRKRSTWKKVLGVMGCLVVFCTTYALILPAITEEHTAYCGVEEHTHSEEAGCYEKVLVCGFDDTGATAEPGHVHTDACYEEQQVLICQETESAGHVHDETCYDAEGTLVCGQEAGAGAHTHGESCYQTERVLVCGQTGETAAPSDEPHVHTDACYELKLVCQKTEHTHSTACFSNPEADVETAEDWEKDFEKVELTGYYAEDLLTIAETQLGYTESQKNYLVTTNDAGEEVLKGYTRYGAWYGDAYGDWCAMFVSFCMNYAKVSTDDIPINASCPGWVEALSDEKLNLYVSAEDGYIPNPGDLIFFDYTDGAESGDGSADHVGIVSRLIYDEETQKAIDEAAKDTENPDALTAVLASAVPEKIETIEGNSNNQVQKVKYDFADADIMGYGRMPLGSWKSLSSEGEDYSITVSYSAVAELPEDTRLEVREILSGTEEYQTYAARAAEAMNEEEGEVNRRFFDITLLSGDTAVEPAAPVKVDVSFPEQPAAEEDTVLHFPENSEEVEVLTASVDEDGLHYEQDGFSVVGFTASQIDTSKTYAIVNNGYALTLNSESTNNPSLGVQAVENISTIPDSLLRWQFSTSGGGYTIRTTASNGTTYYLRIENQNKLTITDRSGQATAFTWSAANGTLSYTNRGTTYYISIAASGATASTTRSTVSLYYDPDAGKVATISPSSTTINLFDYRVNMGTDYDDWKENSAQSYTGINEGHALLFRSSGWGGSAGDGNAYYSGVNQGIVKNQLENGYPVLSDTKGFTGPSGAAMTRGSLDYLFDLNNLSNSDGKVYKRAYSNVKGLLQLGSDGYYYYDSTQNYAEFPVNATTGESTNNNRFNVYDTAAIGSGSFFPFDEYATASGKGTGSNDLNHYFGMTMTTYFVQNYSGYANAEKTTHTTFEFSGDDDVWIFIDGVLVADLGGIHDAQGVKIDFAEGTVTIDDVDYPSGEAGTNKTTYFKDIFAGTDVELATYNGNTTLVNNSSHTLNFYYLERGANASNMKLKYNLLEIPTTSIYKIDQYGTPLAGAEFAVYGATKQADGTYLYKDNNGNDVSLTGMTWDYRRSDVGGDRWDIILSDGTVIPCKYHGTTDGNGEMVFQSPDGSLYSLDDLAKDVIGSNYFILREVDVPDGYRTVSDENWFYIDEVAGVMICDSTYTSGVWASNNASVTASSTLYAAESYNDVAHTMGFQIASGNEHYSYDGYMTVPEAGTTGTVTMKGTLFAVVLKRNDKGIDDIDSWYPVYGSDNDGYQIVEYGTGTDYARQINAVIAAAKAQEDPDCTGPGSATFTPSTLGGGVTAQVVLENLPGKIDRYYTYMQQKIGGSLLTNSSAGVSTTDPQYFVAYYYTSASDLSGATDANTVRVYSRENVIEDNDYDAFDIAWGTTIEVPNMENRLFFQKRDEGKSNSRTAGLLNGAVFALYPAHDAPTSADPTINVIYYVGEAEDGSTVYIGMYPSGSANYGKAAVFTNTALLGDGTYEIETDGIDFSDVNGLVDNTSGTAGVITVTLTEPVSGVGTQGAKYYIRPVTNAAGETMVGVTHSTCDYINEAGTGHFTKLPEGEYFLREILAPSGYEVNTTDIPVLVNELGVYANAGVDGDKVAVGNGIGYLSKTIDVFANLNEIDESLAWVYGALLRSDATGFTAFDDVTHDVIHVADTDWMFVTHDSTKDNPGYGSGKSNSRSEAMVIYYEYNGDLSDSGKHVIFDYTPNDDGGGQDARSLPDTVTAVDFTPTQAGQTYNGALLYRLWTTEGWSDLAIYQDCAYGYNMNHGTTYYEDLTGYGNLANLFSSSTFVQVTDARSAVDLDVKKVDSTDTTKVLEGAQFRIRRETTDTDGTTYTAWYRYDEAADSTVWEPVEAEATVVTTDEPGIAHFYDLTPTSTVKYFLEEYKAPSGYVSVEEIEFKITQEGSTEAGYEPTMTLVTTGYTLSDPDDTSGTRTYTLTVPNELDPNTYHAVVNLDITKVIQGNETPLEGAEFQLYREENGQKLYYKYTQGDTDIGGNVIPAKTEWVAQAEADTLTSDANGQVPAFLGLNDIVTETEGATTYYLVETAAPDGYNLLTEPIKIELDISDGARETPVVTVAVSVGKTNIYTTGGTVNPGSGYNVTAAEPVQGEAVGNVITVTYGYTLTVPNSTGYELPHTGGPGTTTLALIGLTLIALAGCGLVWKRKRGGAA